jgi:hypothetical protein
LRRNINRVEIGRNEGMVRRVEGEEVLLRKRIYENHRK